jgi:hypothetical protein
MEERSTIYGQSDDVAEVALAARSNAANSE